MHQKERYFFLNYFDKTEQLNIENVKLKRIRFVGNIMSVNWRTEFTKFDIYDYVKLSKKQRNHEIEKKEKKVLNYNYTGICISANKNSEFLNSSFVVRNVFDSFPIEITFPLFSPQILGIAILSTELTRKQVAKNKLYYLRNKEIPLSKISFNYVFDN